MVLWGSLGVLVAAKKRFNIFRPISQARSAHVCIEIGVIKSKLLGFVLKIMVFRGIFYFFYFFYYFLLIFHSLR